MVRELEGGRYLAADVRRGGEPAANVLARHVLPRLIEGIAFDQTMRWIGTPGESAEAVALRRTSFSRPIRWLLALHGEQVVPLRFAGLLAGRETRSLRFGDPEVLSIARASAYRGALAKAGVVVDPAERRRLILEQARALAAAVEGEIDSEVDLAEEVSQLVEAPYALRGSFDPAFLTLPEEVLAAVMKKHQRYFPVRKASGGLLPHFIVVRNGGEQGMDSIRAGNEHVLRARFADAEFFLRKDQAQPLEFYRGRLEQLTFHARLGSMLDKAGRIDALTPQIAADVGLTGVEAKTAQRTAFLCKADLATAMVAEMTSLQGVVGRIYAQRSGEPEAVAQAIYEHYLPRFSGDGLPESPVGVVVGLADRVDTLAGLFAADARPTGTRDPFALRRTALGLIEILVARGIEIEIGDWLDKAAQYLPVQLSDDRRTNCLLFLRDRQGTAWLGQGHRYDVVQAVINVSDRLGKPRCNPARAAAALSVMEVAVADSGWPPVLQAYARCARIVPRPTSRDTNEGRGSDGAVDPGLFEMDAERSLLTAIEATTRPVSAQALVESLKGLVSPITEFFDKVLVMDEDPAKRANRLALVQRVVALADGIADLSKLEGF
jgi:glycyl-tRNA synthetase